MANNDGKLSRRQILKGAAVSAIALQTITFRHSASASEALTEDDPMAKALAYVADASTVNKEEQPTYSPEQNCANCIQFQGKEGDAAGGCAIFPGKSVAASGWCKVWVTK